MTSEATNMDLNFTTVDVPDKIVTRTTAPNPFIVNNLFPTQVVDDKPKAIQLTLPANTEADEKVIKTLVTQARKAGALVDKTARVKREDTVTESGKGTKADPTVEHKSATLTFWTVDKISKPRAAVEEATVTLNSVPDAKAS